MKKVFNAKIVGHELFTPDKNDPKREAVRVKLTVGTSAALPGQAHEGHPRDRGEGPAQVRAAPVPAHHGRGLAAGARAATVRDRQASRGVH